MVKRTNEKLWEEVKKDLMKKRGGIWSARIAQEAVREYKKRGGGYIGDKPKNSLVKWTEEKWDYSGKKGESRYLPEKVRKVLPKDILEKENKMKGKKIGSRIPYSKELVDIMKKKKIF